MVGPDGTETEDRGRTNTRVRKRATRVTAIRNGRVDMLTNFPA